MYKIIFLLSLTFSLVVNADQKSDVNQSCREYFGKQMQNYVSEGKDTVDPNISSSEVKIIAAIVSDYKRCCSKGTASCFDQKFVGSYKIPAIQTSGFKPTRKKITCEVVSEASVICGGEVYLHETKGVLSCSQQDRLNRAKPVDDQGMGLESGSSN